MELIPFAAIIIFACFVQAVAGFGLPLIAMPVLIALFGIRAAVPLMAIIILQQQLIMIVRYRLSLNVRAVARISAAAVLGIPIGVLFLSRIPEAITISVLGLILIFYVLYSFLKLPVPQLQSQLWAYIFGFLGGIGGGAYNMAAPPMIIYADTQRWPPRIFKANLQGFFLIITIAAIITHAFSGNITRTILNQSLLAVPFVLIGAFAGFALDRFINPTRFRQIVLGLLLIMGFSLILTS